jgi:hypothetical protein
MPLDSCRLALSFLFSSSASLARSLSLSSTLLSLINSEQTNLEPGEILFSFEVALLPLLFSPLRHPNHLLFSLPFNPSPQQQPPQQQFCVICQPALLLSNNTTTAFHDTKLEKSCASTIDHHLSHRQHLLLLNSPSPSIVRHQQYDRSNG